MRQRFCFDRGMSSPILAWARGVPERARPADSRGAAPSAGSRSRVGRATVPAENGCIASSGSSRTSAPAPAGGAVRASPRPIRCVSMSRDHSARAPRPRPSSETAALGRAAGRGRRSWCPTILSCGPCSALPGSPTPGAALRGVSRGRRDQVAVRGRPDTVNTSDAGKSGKLVAEVRQPAKWSAAAETTLERRGASTPGSSCRACRPSST